MRKGQLTGRSGDGKGRKGVTAGHEEVAGSEITVKFSAHYREKGDFLEIKAQFKPK